MPSLADILADPSLNGVYRTAGPVADLPGLVRLDARVLGGKAGLLTALGTALAFPDYYGANWDALEECLNDLSWRDGGVLLLIEHAAGVEEALLDPLIDIWQEASAVWAGQGRGCVLILAGLDRADLPEVL